MAAEHGHRLGRSASSLVALVVTTCLKFLKKLSSKGQDSTGPEGG